MATLANAGKRDNPAMTAVATSRKGSDVTIRRLDVGLYRFLPAIGKTTNNSTQPTYKTYWG